MTPFTITPALIGPYAFSKTNRETLNDKLDYYFQDFSFVPLFVQVGHTIESAVRCLPTMITVSFQENYLKNAPSRAGRGDDPDTQMKRLDLISKAADAISDGDLIDRMIHGQVRCLHVVSLHLLIH
jgi:replication factor C subunit 1